MKGSLEPTYDLAPPRPSTVNSGPAEASSLAGLGGTAAPAPADAGALLGHNSSMAGPGYGSHYYYPSQAGYIYTQQAPPSHASRSIDGAPHGSYKSHQAPHYYHPQLAVQRPGPPLAAYGPVTPHAGYAMRPGGPPPGRSAVSPFAGRRNTWAASADTADAPHPSGTTTYDPHLGQAAGAPSHHYAQVRNELPGYGSEAHNKRPFLPAAPWQPEPRQQQQHHHHLGAPLMQAHQGAKGAPPHQHASLQAIDPESIFIFMILDYIWRRGWHATGEVLLAQSGISLASAHASELLRVTSAINRMCASRPPSAEAAHHAADPGRHGRGRSEGGPSDHHLGFLKDWWFSFWAMYQDKVEGALFAASPSHAVEPPAWQQAMHGYPSHHRPDRTALGDPHHQALGADGDASWKEERVHGAPPPFARGAKEALGRDGATAWPPNGDMQRPQAPQRHHAEGSPSLSETRRLILHNSMAALGLDGRDPASLTSDEQRLIVQRIKAHLNQGGAAAYPADAAAAASMPAPPGSPCSSSDNLYQQSPQIEAHNGPSAKKRHTRRGRKERPREAYKAVPIEEEATDALVTIFSPKMHHHHQGTHNPSPMEGHGRSLDVTHRYTGGLVLDGEQAGHGAQGVEAAASVAPHYDERLPLYRKAASPQSLKTRMLEAGRTAPAFYASSSLGSFLPNPPQSVLDDLSLFNFFDTEFPGVGTSTGLHHAPAEVVMPSLAAPSSALGDKTDQRAPSHDAIPKRPSDSPFDRKLASMAAAPSSTAYNEADDSNNGQRNAQSSQPRSHLSSPPSADIFAGTWGMPLIDQFGNIQVDDGDASSQARSSSNKPKSASSSTASPPTVSPKAEQATPPPAIHSESQAPLPPLQAAKDGGREGEGEEGEREGKSVAKGQGASFRTGGSRRGTPVGPLPSSEASECSNPLFPHTDAMDAQAVRQSAQPATPPPKARASPAPQLKERIASNGSAKLAATTTITHAFDLGRHRSGGKASSCSFSSDNVMCASAGHDRNVLVYSVASGRLLGSFVECHTLQITQVRFLTIGKRRLMATASFDKTVKIWDLGPTATESPAEGEDDVHFSHLSRIVQRAREGGPALSLRGAHDAAIWSIDFVPSPPSSTSLRLCSIDASGLLVLWDLAKGGTVLFKAVVQSPDAACSVTVRQLRTKPRQRPSDPSILAISNGSKIEIFDCDRTAFIGSLVASAPRAAKPVVAISWGETPLLCNFLIGITADAMCIWNMAPVFGGEGMPLVVAHQVIPDDKLASCAFIREPLPSGDGGDGRHHKDHQAAPGRLRVVIGGHESLYLGQVEAGAEEAATGEAAGTVEMVRCAAAHDGLVVAVAVTRSGPVLLASASHDGSCKLWRVADRAVPRSAAT